MPTYIPFHSNQNYLSSPNFQLVQIRSYLCSTELLKVQNRMICAFRNSVLFDQVVNNACRNSWNHNSKRFALSETPLSGIQKVLYLTELLLVIIKTIWIKRNSWNHKQELFWMKRNSWNRYSEWFALSGTPFDIKEKWFALKGEQETDIHLQFALNEASETIIRFYLNKTELRKPAFLRNNIFADVFLILPFTSNAFSLHFI